MPMLLQQSSKNTFLTTILIPYAISLFGSDSIGLTNQLLIQILTFDERGISSHPNHISIPTGVLKLMRNLGETSSLKHPLRLFTLVTASLPYKYLSFTSVGLGKAEMYAFKGMQKLELLIIDILSFWYPEISTPATPLNRDTQAMPVFISDFRRYQKALESMQAHESQLVWFRYLNVAFSKYLWVNAYVELRA